MSVALSVEVFASLSALEKGEDQETEYTNTRQPL